METPASGFNLTRWYLYADAQAVKSAAWSVDKDALYAVRFFVKNWSTQPRIESNDKTLAMFKSYNIVSGAGVQAPYTFYRMHKLELSVVRQITGEWSVQIGAFVSPLGQNIVAEQGIGSTLWYRF